MKKLLRFFFPCDFPHVSWWHGFLGGLCLGVFALVFNIFPVWPLLIGGIVCGVLAGLVALWLLQGRR